MARGIGTTATLAMAGVAIIIGVAGCMTPTPDPTPAPTTPTTTAPPASASPEPSTAPALRPELSASENLAFFDSVGLGVIAANPEAGGRDFIDALVAAGFDKAQMQVTADRTTVDLQADSVQFSVLFQSECLVGQYGPKSGGYHSAVRPVLATGTCLVGLTRPIDW